MKEYVIKKIITPPTEESWLGANVAEIDLYPWKEFIFEYKSTARVLYNDEAVYVLLETNELPIIAKQTERNSAVCTDSCMEFFFCPNIENGSYFNFEFNALGTMHLSIGKSLYDRTMIPDDLSLFDIKPELMETGWRISFKIPFEFIRKYVGELTENMTGNFYKCGDETGHRHYGMWNLVEVSTPNFHIPEFFGKLKFEK